MRFSPFKLAAGMLELSSKNCQLMTHKRQVSHLCAAVSGGRHVPPRVGGIPREFVDGTGWREHCQSELAVQCLYCGMETGHGGSHPNTSACVVTLRSERARLASIVAERAATRDTSIPEGDRSQRPVLRPIDPDELRPAVVRSDAVRLPVGDPKSQISASRLSPAEAGKHSR
jgi:hypothetical protein